MTTNSSVRARRTRRVPPGAPARRLRALSFDTHDGGHGRARRNRRSCLASPAAAVAAAALDDAAPPAALPSPAPEMLASPTPLAAAALRLRRRCRRRCCGAPPGQAMAASARLPPGEECTTRASRTGVEGTLTGRPAAVFSTTACLHLVPMPPCLGCRPSTRTHLATRISQRISHPWPSGGARKGEAVQIRRVRAAATAEAVAAVAAAAALPHPAPAPGAMACPLPARLNSDAIARRQHPSRRRAPPYGSPYE